MDIPFALEMAESARSLGIRKTHDWLTAKIYTSPGCEAWRVRALRSAKKQPERLTIETYWGLSSKHRFDLLAAAIAMTATQLGQSATLGHIYLPFMHNDVTKPYEPRFGDDMFWYAIESGFRFASSGWERIALLLDLVLTVRVGKHCTFPKVIESLEQWPGMDKLMPFQKLKEFRNGNFLDLERGVGQGLHHEATHLIPTGVRFMMEELERRISLKKTMKLTPAQYHELLLAHYGHYLNGINHALALIDASLSIG